MDLQSYYQTVFYTKCEENDQFDPSNTSYDYESVSPSPSGYYQSDKVSSYSWVQESNHHPYTPINGNMKTPHHSYIPTTGDMITPHHSDSQPTTPKPPQLPTQPPQAILQSRRLSANARERKRMTKINCGYDRLRKVLPGYHNCQLSKMEALQMAHSYIRHLQQVLQAVGGEEVQSVG